MLLYPTPILFTIHYFLACLFVAIGARVPWMYNPFYVSYRLIFKELIPFVATGADALCTARNIDFRIIRCWCRCCDWCKRCNSCDCTKETLPLEKDVTYLFINTYTPPLKTGASVASGAHAATGIAAPRWFTFLLATLFFCGNLFGQTAAKSIFIIPHFEEYQIYLEYKIEFQEAIEISIGDTPHHIALYYHLGSTAESAKLVDEFVSSGTVSLKLDCGIYYIQASGKGNQFMKLIKLIVSDDQVYVFSIGQG